MVLDNVEAWGLVEWVFVISSILMLPLIIYSIYASFKVHSTFNKYKQVQVRGNLTGAQLAEQLLMDNQVDCRVELGHGHLSDHYDPRSKTVVLSPEVFHGTDVAAYGVAAHEVGHAIQDATGYIPLKLRQIVVKSTGLINRILMPIIIIGLFAQFFVFFDSPIFIWFIAALVVFYGLTFLISLITLPTEYNASARAREMLQQSNLMDEPELRGASRVLSAAAITYVAAMAVSLIFFLRNLSLLLMILARSRR